MGKMDLYLQTLRDCTDWDTFLLENSNLPGPRGNLELAHAVARSGNLAQFESWLADNSPEVAPVNHPREFLAFCGALGLGWLVGRGQRQHLPRLRALASDPRWRTREAVATGLQYFGDQDMPALLDEMVAWGAGGNPYEQRAAAAAVCEPRLLGDSGNARRVLALLDQITGSILGVSDRKNDAFQALRKGLGYGWSVAVAALPVEGKPCMEKWIGHTDPDIAWIMRENLKKNRIRGIF
jgi:hypothetical protein